MKDENKLDPVRDIIESMVNKFGDNQEEHEPIEDVNLDEPTPEFGLKLLRLIQLNLMQEKTIIEAKLAEISEFIQKIEETGECHVKFQKLQEDE